MILSDARYSLRWILWRQRVAIVVQDTATRYTTATPCKAACAASVCQQSDACVNTHLCGCSQSGAVCGCRAAQGSPRRALLWCLPLLASLAPCVPCIPSPGPHLPCARVALATGCSSALLLSTPEILVVAGNGGRTQKAPASHVAKLEACPAAGSGPVAVEPSGRLGTRIPRALAS